MSDQDNEERGIVLAVLAGIILLAISLAIGVALHHTSKGASGARATASGATAGTAGLAGAAGAAGGAAAGLAAGAAAAAGGVPPTATGSASAAVVADGPSVRVENGVVKFYFGSGSADLAPGAAEALGDVVKGVAAGKKAVISGYHDATGDPVKNEELAKQRALAVRGALSALGIGDDKMELKKPVVTTAAGSNAEARRVEVTLE
jgi:outer membrane protein OmpA-like peptidoglycan-associated protein